MSDAPDLLAPATPGFVRPARRGDLEALGHVHAESMLASLRAALGGALPPEVRQTVGAADLSRRWETAVTSPPSPEHHVLVATQADEVVGLAATAPSWQVDATGAVLPGGAKAAEVTAMGVLPRHQRHGHGSRLLTACADHARVDGAEVLVVWAVRGDESWARALAAAGLALTGAHRRLSAGAGVQEDCWAAAL